MKLLLESLTFTSTTSCTGSTLKLQALMPVLHLHLYLLERAFDWQQIVFWKFHMATLLVEMVYLSAAWYEIIGSNYFCTTLTHQQCL